MFQRLHARHRGDVASKEEKKKRSRLDALCCGTWEPWDVRVDCPARVEDARS